MRSWLNAACGSKVAPPNLLVRRRQADLLYLLDKYSRNALHAAFPVPAEHMRVVSCDSRVVLVVSMQRSHTNMQER
jgi:hypothetical protein